MAGSCRGKFPRERHGLGPPLPKNTEPGDASSVPCVAYIWTPNSHEAEKLRNALKPILQTIDPELDLLSIGDYWSGNGNLDSEVILSHIQSKEEKLNKNGSVHTNRLKTPSLAFVLMLKEDHPFEGTKSTHKFKDLPWKFHHKIELSNTKGQKIQSIAKQEFYQPGPGLPLWAICPVHFGSQHLRYTIFTCNFSAMMDFYRILTGKEVEHVKANFCLFELFSTKYTSVQLALKQSAQLHPSPCRTAALCFRVQSTGYLETLLGASLEKISESLFSVSDPDGNCLLIEQVTNNNMTTSPALMQNKTIVNGNKTTVSTSDRAKAQRGPISFGELWSETSSFDSGQHSSSFNSMMESTLSEDVDSCISSDIDSSEFDSPLWPHSFNITLATHHQRELRRGSVDKWGDSKETNKHTNKACKPWELSCEHDNWFDTLTAASSCIQERRSLRHEITPRNARMAGVDPGGRVSRGRRGHFM